MGHPIHRYCHHHHHSCKIKHCDPSASCITISPFHSARILVISARQLTKSKCFTRRLKSPACQVHIGPYHIQSLAPATRNSDTTTNKGVKSFNSAFIMPFHGEPFIRFDVVDREELVGRADLTIQDSSVLRPCFIGEIQLLGSGGQQAGYLAVYIELTGDCVAAPLAQYHTAASELHKLPVCYRLDRYSIGGKQQQKQQWIAKPENSDCMFPVRFDATKKEPFTNECRRNKCNDDRCLLKGDEGKCSCNEDTLREILYEYEGDVDKCTQVQGNTNLNQRKCKGYHCKCNGDQGKYNGDQGKYNGDQGKCSCSRGNCSGDRAKCSGDRAKCSRDQNKCSGDQGKLSLDHCKGSDDQGKSSGEKGKHSGDKGKYSRGYCKCSDDRGKCSDDQGKCSSDQGKCSSDQSKCSGDHCKCSSEQGKCSGDHCKYSGDWGKCRGDQGKCRGSQGICWGDQGICRGDQGKRSGEQNLCRGDQGKRSGEQNQCSSDKGKCSECKHSCFCKCHGYCAFPSQEPKILLHYNECSIRNEYKQLHNREVKKQQCRSKSLQNDSLIQKNYKDLSCGLRNQLSLPNPPAVNRHSVAQTQQNKEIGPNRKDGIKQKLLSTSESNDSVSKESAPRRHRSLGGKETTTHRRRYSVDGSTHSENHAFGLVQDMNSFYRCKCRCHNNLNILNFYINEERYNNKVVNKPLKNCLQTAKMNCNETQPCLTFSNSCGCNKNPSTKCNIRDEAKNLSDSTRNVSVRHNTFKNQFHPLVPTTTETSTHSDSSPGETTLLGSFRTHGSQSSASGFFRSYHSIAITIHRCEEIRFNSEGRVSGTTISREAIMISRLGGLEMQSDPVINKNGYFVFESTFIYPFDCHRSLRLLLAERLKRNKSMEVVGIGKFDLPSLVRNYNNLSSSERGEESNDSEKNNDSSISVSSHHRHLRFKCPQSSFSKLQSNLPTSDSAKSSTTLPIESFFFQNVPLVSVSGYPAGSALISIQFLRENVVPGKHPAMLAAINKP